MARRRVPPGTPDGMPSRVAHEVTLGLGGRAGCRARTLCASSSPRLALSTLSSCRREERECKAAERGEERECKAAERGERM